MMALRKLDGLSGCQGNGVKREEKWNGRRFSHLACEVTFLGGGWGAEKCRRLSSHLILFLQCSHDHHHHQQ